MRRPSSLLLFILLAGTISCQSGLLPIHAAKEFADAGDESCTRDATPKTQAIQQGSGPQTVRGTVDVAPALRGRAAPGDTMYVMARDFSSQKMLAVTRLFVPKQPSAWPISFTLSDERLVSDMTVSISARIDKDGDATTKLKGDLVGAAAHAVQLPQDSVRIVIDEAL